MGWWRQMSLVMVVSMMFTATSFASVPDRLEYQGYLTDAVGTPINCQGCATTYTFKFTLFDEQTAGSVLWTETHAEVDIAQGVFRVALGLETPLEAELLEETRWLEIQINGQAPLVPRQRIISVPYALRADLAERAVESENAVTLGGQPPESFVQVTETDIFLTEPELQAVLNSLGYVPGDNDTLADINDCLEDEIIKWNGTTWVCAVNADTDTLSSLFCAAGEIAEWNGNAWSCSSALDGIQANIDQVQINLETLDSSLDPIAKSGLSADLADGDDDTQLSEAQVLAMVGGAGYITGDHFSGAWTDLSGVPADILDGDANTQLSDAEILATVAGAGYVTGDHFSGAWADLSGVPADILDGDANTDILSSLGCSAGEMPEWNGGTWICTVAGQWTDEGSHLAANNATNVVITDAGRVGIGTTDPQAALEVVGTDAIVVPIGTTTQRPDSPQTGMVRFNSTTGRFEGFDGTEWLDLSGAAADLVELGLELHLDAADGASYPGSGDIWYDISGSNNHATKWGSVGFSTDGDGAFSFDGAAFDVTTWGGFQDAGEITLEVWAKVRSHRSYNTGIITNYVGGSGKMNWMWSEDGGGRSIHNNGMKGHTYSSGGLYEFNQWYRFALRYRAGVGYEFFVNDDLVHTQSATGDLGGSPAGTIGIGSREDHAEPCDSLISIARIYTRALSDTELDDNFNAQKARFGY